MSARGQDTISYNKALIFQADAQKSLKLKINSYPLSEVGLFLAFCFSFYAFPTKYYLYLLSVF